MLLSFLPLALIMVRAGGVDVVTIYFTRHASSQSNALLDLIRLSSKSPLRTDGETINEFYISRPTGFRVGFDAPLCEYGHSQARRLGILAKKNSTLFPVVRMLNGDMVIAVSNLVRTHQTFAEFISQYPAADLDVHVLSCLQEVYENTAAMCVKDGVTDPSEAVTSAIVRNLPRINWKIGDSDRIVDHNRRDSARDLRPRFAVFLRWLRNHARNGKSEFLITGHSQWLMKFFDASYPPNPSVILEIEQSLKNKKLGNASMMRFDFDLKNVQIVVGSVQILFDKVGESPEEVIGSSNDQNIGNWMVYENDGSTTELQVHEIDDDFVFVRMSEELITA